MAMKIIPAKTPKPIKSHFMNFLSVNPIMYPTSAHPPNGINPPAIAIVVVVVVGIGKVALVAIHSCSGMRNLPRLNLVSKAISPPLVH